MSWEEEITQKLLELDNTPIVRVDKQQEITQAQKLIAGANLGITASATLISGDEYKITMV